ncbi:monocarboxylate transporter 12-B-like isoform X2 [Anneissia japonica]|uniref:monocarboxylate transporter 12-B-like isoform X2 n=1 Tax=Anneissia japonica TaxID=1529436 RepID=UPI00142554B5|nr:monocarboxylate transporter 12-B-like isoform X2 [Anneissia japonica]
MYTLVLLNMVKRGIITQAVAEDLKCTDGFVSFWGGIQLALVAGSGPLSAVLLRRIGMRKLGTITGLTSFGTLCMMSVARSTFTLALAMCLQGVCIGILYTSSVVVVQKVYTGNFSQVNVVLLIASISTNATAPLIQILLEHYGWRGAVVILAAVHLHIPVFSLLLDIKIGKTKADPKDTLEELGQHNFIVYGNAFLKGAIKSLHAFKGNSQLIALFLNAVCNGFYHTAYCLFMVPYAVENGITAFDSSTLIALPVIPCILIRLAIFFHGKIDVPCTVRLHAIGQVSEFCSCFFITFGRRLSMFYVGSILHGFAFGIHFYSMLCLAPAFVNKSFRDYALSWIIFSDGLAVIATAIVGLYTNSYLLGFQISSGVQICAVALVIYIGLLNGQILGRI